MYLGWGGGIAAVRNFVRATTNGRSAFGVVRDGKVFSFEPPKYVELFERRTDTDSSRTPSPSIRSPRRRLHIANVHAVLYDPGDLLVMARDTRYVSRFFFRVSVTYVRSRVSSEVFARAPNVTAGGFRDT